jgi:hypothetical protein
MKIIFITGFIVLCILVSGTLQLTKAQDTAKRAGAFKKAVVKAPAVTAPATVAAGTKPPVPINPKTGKPYTKYGYGYYATNKYAVTKAARIADSIKKAAALKAGTPAVVTLAVKDTTVAAAADKSLNGQYQYFLSKIYNYQRPMAAALWKNVTDSLNVGRRKLSDAQAKVLAETKTINDLQATKDGDDTVSATDSIDVFGLTLSKNTYSFIMWGLVIALGAIAGFVVARSGSLKREASYRTDLYTELEQEFKTFKSKAIDKEKKLARELQTERNKVDELMGR